MKFSLILSTLHRVNEVDAFLASLQYQTFKSFELIIVDQNSDDRLVPLIQKYHNDFIIRHVKSGIGLSIGRNRGLQYISGDVVAFPDDDCTYPPELLANIAELFEQKDISILMGKTIEKESGEIIAGKPILQKMPMRCSYFGGSSTTLFIRLHGENRNEIRFDERFGVGAAFYSEEENDLVMDLLKKGWKGLYDPDLNYVYHPKKDTDFTDFERAKIRGYGLGALVAKHFFSRCGLTYFVRYNLVRPLSGIVLNAFRMDRARAKYYLYRYIGIWSGFFDFIRLGSRI